MAGGQRKQTARMRVFRVRCSHGKPEALQSQQKMCYTAAMPNYGVAQVGGTVAAVAPGDQYFLWNAETPTAPQASVAFARQMGPGQTDAGITFTISFASAPTDSLVIQGSNVDSDAQYQSLYTSTNKQLDAYTDTGRWAFYRAKLVTQSAGGAVTIIAQR